MHLQPLAPRPDPELWRAVYEAQATPPSRHESDDSTRAHTLLHGMPADRSAMAASQLPMGARRVERLR